MTTSATSIVLDSQQVRPSATRVDLAASLRGALSRGTGLAAGKLGLSEQALLAYPFLLQRCRSMRQEVALTAQTRLHSAVQMGVFPSDRDALLSFSTLHAEATRSLDFVGLVRGRLEADLIRELGITGRTLSLYDLEPDRSIPDNSDSCYLPELTGYRVLIVSSIAKLLSERADRTTFEAVWAKTGKPWFAPAQVTALEFPYTYDVDTQRRFGRSENLLDAIVNRIDPRTFDVALIAGSSLGIPIASAIKAQGRSAIALGGSLQVLFGVSGKRWREDPVWQRDHITDAWIDVPAHLVPRIASDSVDGGAYW